MIEKLVFRKAESKDLEFVAEAIIEAEKSNTDKFVYTSVFDMSENEFRDMLREILNDEIPGQKMYLPGFMICQIDGEYAAAACSWIEGEEGLSSTVIAGRMLVSYIDRDKLLAAKEKFESINSLRFDREKGALQLESIYVRKAFRGKSLAAKILDQIIDENKKNNPALKKAQIIVAKTNDKAVSAYQKLGFRIVDEKQENSNNVFELLQWNSIVLMNKEI